MQDDQHDLPRPAESTYEPPKLETLGTLADLTLGADGDDPDTIGGLFNSTPPT